MNRRSLFGLLAGAVMASAIEVCGWVPPPRKWTNFADYILDIWEDRDASFYTSGGFKVLVESSYRRLPKEPIT